MTTTTTRRHRAFTLVELLLVVTIIAVILALILVGLSKVQQQARATECLSNLRSLALANQSYAADNEGRLASPRTDSLPPDSGMPGISNPWVNTSGALVGGKETNLSLERGVMWPYLDQSYKAYVSPMDPTARRTFERLPAGALADGRVRSYSFNAFVGCGAYRYDKRCDDLWAFPDPASADMPEPYRGGQFNTMTLSSIPQPSRTMATITEEDTYGYNTQGWCIRVRPPSGTAGDWIDTPALWNPGRVNIAYMDGSFEAPNIIYEQLAKIMQPNPNQPPIHFAIETGSRPAFKFMSSILLPGIVRPELQ
ncbi:MAG: type II secretion system protein [Planctomycetota bacterium]